MYTKGDVCGRNSMIGNLAGLTIVVRNESPKREGHYPKSWMVYSAGQAVKIAVAHNKASYPYVKDRLREA